MIDVTLTKISSKDDDNNNSPTSKVCFLVLTSDIHLHLVVFPLSNISYMVVKFLQGETLNLTDVNKMLNLSRTLDARDLEISYRQGFMVGSAWKDCIISSTKSRSYNWVSISDLVFVSVLYSRKILTF